MNEQATVNKEKSFKSMSEGELRRAQVQTRPTFCDVHQNEPYQRFCKDCRCFICIECITGTHHGHTYARIEEAVHTSKVEFCACVDLLRDLVSRKTKTIESVRTNRFDYMQENKTIVEKVKQKAEELKKYIDNTKDKNLDGIERANSQDLLYLQHFEDNLKADITELQAYIKSCEEKCSFALKDEIDILVKEMKKKIDKFVEVVEFTPKTPPWFLCAETDKVVLDAACGNVKYMFGEGIVLKRITLNADDEANPNYASAAKANRSLQANSVYLEKIFAFSTFEIKEPPVAISAAGQGKIWISAGNGNATQYYKDGSQLCFAKNGNGVGDIAVTANGDLFVTNFITDKVLRIKKNGTVEIFYDFNPYHPHGICISMDGEIILTLRHNTRSGELVRLLRSGEIVQTIKNGFLFTSLFKKPWFLTENINRDLWVQDGGLGKVTVTNKDGDFRFEYKGPPEGTFEVPFTPVGLAHTTNGHVLIVDQSNASMHQLNADGCLLVVYSLNPSVIIPCVIDVDNFGNLWMCSFTSRRIVVFESPK